MRYEIKSGAGKNAMIYYTAGRIYCGFIGNVRFMVIGNDVKKMAIH
jgi:hypothetical protein